MTQSVTESSRTSWLGRLLSLRSVQIAVGVWILANAAVLILGRDGLPFDRPSVAGNPVTQQLILANAGLIEVFALMAVVFGLTRRRVIPDIAARSPDVATARREVLLLVAYGVLCQIGGYLLGSALGWHPLGFHLVGTIYGTHDHVATGEVVTWAVYNFVAYAVLPFAFFRRRYSAEQLNLRSSDRRNDVLVIVVILIIESLVEFAALGTGLFELGGKQLLLGVPATFALYFLGTVMPTMIFVYCILLPRFLRLTGSVATTVILGGLTYALLHAIEGWTAFDTATNAVLSVAFILFQYFGPGMIKTVLTLRTGNAWVHVWAYHAFAPHVIVDTPTMVKILPIR